MKMKILMSFNPDSLIFVKQIYRLTKKYLLENNYEKANLLIDGISSIKNMHIKIRLIKNSIYIEPPKDFSFSNESHIKAIDEVIRIVDERVTKIQKILIRSRKLVNINYETRIFLLKNNREELNKLTKKYPYVSIKIHEYNDYKISPVTIHYFSSLTPHNIIDIINKQIINIMSKSYNKNLNMNNFLFIDPETISQYLEDL